MNVFIEKIQTKLLEMFGKKPTKKNDLNIYSNFELPIHYLENDRHNIEESLSNDLELTPSTLNKENKETLSIYEYYLQPKNEFAKNIMEKWKTYYTSNEKFINDSKNVVLSMNQYEELMNTQKYALDSERIIQIWKNIKEDNYFLQKYNYMDFDIVKHLNYSEPFLQAISILHIVSPLISIILPIIFLLFPFILLKLKNVPITFFDYLRILKVLAKNHFLGIAVNSFQNFSPINFIYLLGSLGFFLFQIYQNINTCKKYYSNIKNINNDIIDLKKYLIYSIASMDTHLKLIENLSTYKPFYDSTLKHKENLQQMFYELNNITQFSHSLSKCMSLGKMLKSYYILYDNYNYAEALKYSMGFEGYINNLIGINTNFQTGNIGLCSIQKNKKCSFKDQYYPVIEDFDSIKNDCNLNKNMIISSPNKSGKTTFLKTTLINIILSQQMGMGYYKECLITPYTHLHCYLNIPDTSGRDSLFQAESRRCKDILDKIQNSENPYEHHFCIFDELYSGTNPEEATKAGTAFLKYLQKFKHVEFILTTHYIKVCKKFLKSEYTNNFKMNVIINKDGSFDYKYKLKKGISKIKGATRVLKDMNYPEEIIKSIEEN